MAPRTRKISCTSGLVAFHVGVTEELVEDFLKANKIERVPGSPKFTTEKSVTTIQVPPAEEYVIPDHAWVWCSPENCT